MEEKSKVFNNNSIWKKNSNRKKMEKKSKVLNNNSIWKKNSERKKGKEGDGRRVRLMRTNLPVEVWSQQIAVWRLLYWITTPWPVPGRLQVIFAPSLNRVWSRIRHRLGCYIWQRKASVWWHGASAVGKVHAYVSLPTMGAKISLHNWTGF